MRTADSLDNLLQKAYDTLPLAQRASGNIKLNQFLDALLPVLAISPAPERDQIIAVESLAQAATVTGTNTAIIWTTDVVPSGEIHRYTYLGLEITGAPGSAQVDRINATAAAGIVITDTILHRQMPAQQRINLLADYVNATNDFFIAKLNYLDVWSGGWLQITNDALAVGDVSTVRLNRLRLHGPRQAFNDDRSTDLNFIEA